MTQHKPRLAVWKFASCDGCQLSLLDCEDELLSLDQYIEIAHFLEASSNTQAGPYDLSLVEGSVTTAEDAERIKHIRAMSRCLITIGACATSGGIQSLRNLPQAERYTSLIYPHPEFIDALEDSTPIADHVKVDFELRGCPVNKYQLLEVIKAFVHHRQPNLPTHSVCFECKTRSSVCLMVAEGKPCLGPVTQAGCGALCPSYGRACYGCYGPQDSANCSAISEIFLDKGLDTAQVSRAFHSYNTAREPFYSAGLSACSDRQKE